MEARFLHLIVSDKMNLYSFRGSASLHVGEIRPGGLRGNHRHHTCNESFLIWGAKTKFRLENNAFDKGYAEVIVGAHEVAVAVSPTWSGKFGSCTDYILLGLPGQYN